MFYVIIILSLVAMTVAFSIISERHYKRYLKILDRIDDCPINNQYVIEEALSKLPN